MRHRAPYLTVAALRIMRQQTSAHRQTSRSNKRRMKRSSSARLSVSANSNRLDEDVAGVEQQTGLGSGLPGTRVNATSGL